MNKERKFDQKKESEDKARELAQAKIDEATGTQDTCPVHGTPLVGKGKCNLCGVCYGC